MSVTWWAETRYVVYDLSSQIVIIHQLFGFRIIPGLCFYYIVLFDFDTDGETEVSLLYQSLKVNYHLFQGSDFFYKIVNRNFLHFFKKWQYPRCAKQRVDVREIYICSENRFFPQGYLDSCLIVPWQQYPPKVLLKTLQMLNKLLTVVLQLISRCSAL